MSTSPKRKPKARPSPTKPAPDPKRLLPRLHARLEKERAGLDRWHRRLVRAFHAYLGHYRSVTSITRRIVKLESA